MDRLAETRVVSTEITIQRYLLLSTLRTKCYVESGMRT
jgi:hypothetical protein